MNVYTFFFSSVDSNKPCTALVLYKQPEHVREMLWKGHVGSLSPYKEHKPQDTERLLQ